MSRPEWITDENGKITGYKTPGGADTVFPFSSMKKIVFTVNISGYSAYNNLQVYPSATATVTINCENKTVTISNFNSNNGKENNGLYGRIQGISANTAAFS